MVAILERHQGRRLFPNEPHPLPGAEAASGRSHRTSSLTACNAGPEYSIVPIDHVCSIASDSRRDAHVAQRQTISMAVSESSPYVPAWKRIGLKLKYAKDSTDHNVAERTAPPGYVGSTQGLQESTRASRLKRSLGVDAIDRPAKRFGDILSSEVQPTRVEDGGGVSIRIVTEE